jgi:hypothetical protein
MRVIARVRVIALLSVAMATTGSSLSTAGASPAPAAAPRTGRLLVATGDTFDGGSAVTQTGVETAPGLVPVSLAASEDAEAVVQGGPLLSAYAEPADAARSMRIAVVLLRLPGSTSEPVS